MRVHLHSDDSGYFYVLSSDEKSMTVIIQLSCYAEVVKSLGCEIESPTTEECSDWLWDHEGKWFDNFDDTLGLFK